MGRGAFSRSIEGCGGRVRKGEHGVGNMDGSVFIPLFCPFLFLVLDCRFLGGKGSYGSSVQV